MTSSTTSMIVTALLPVAILLFFIYRKDRKQPEPKKLLLKAFCFGILSAAVSMGIYGILQMFIPNMDPETMSGPIDAIKSAFFGAAIPEEAAKLLMLWLVLRNNKYFDERMDGIVYATCVSMGFAGLENILYLADSPDFLSLGVHRGIFSVPGHFCFAVLMGYYYSLARFYPDQKTKNRILTYAAPVLAHGIYNSILMIGSLSPILEDVLYVLFWVFCITLWRYSYKRINRML